MHDKNHTTKRIGVRDVAKQAGVAKSTAAYVLSRSRTHKVSRDTEQKVMAAARELGYVPNRMAAGLKTGRSGLIGLYFGEREPPQTKLFHGTDTHFMHLFCGLTNACLSYDVFPVTLVHSVNGEVTDSERITRMLHSGIDALVAFMPDMETIECLERLEADGLPVLCIFPTVDKPTSLPSLDVDNTLLGEMAADYLMARGYEQIVALVEPDHHPSSLARREGFEDAMRRAGREPMVHVLPSRQDRTIEAFHAECRGEINTLQADAFFGISGGTTLLASWAFTDRPHWTAEECALLGVDVQLSPNLILVTHFTAPWHVVGERAVELVCRALDSGQPIDRNPPRIAPHRIDGATCPVKRTASV